ncbi:hypothetical protein [Frankia sp. R82]|uniref:hypothetical protein n=1 Tax=Frankia sp. R82 TaxID=2950553 RepID=UPI002042E44F|nr:hypothetical protein [Frankia sp. R82]MCM3884346.1 hypothetical protein [Frankia sp. R82]
MVSTATTVPAATTTTATTTTATTTRATTTRAAAGTGTGRGSSGTAGTRGGQATRLVNLAPVDRHGQPARGWTVEGSEDPNSPIDCGDTSQAFPSPAAVSGDIYYCSPSAAAADACWPTPQPRRMLCLRDPYSTILTALTAGSLVAKVSPPRHPAPLRLDLANGEHCRLRDGGAWGAPQNHPDYVGYYSCGPRDIVWARPDSPTGGIDRTGTRWTVLVGDLTGPLSTVAVATAGFVTTAP